jgi:hypothetical protein
MFRMEGWCLKMGRRSFDLRCIVVLKWILYRE